MSSRLLSILIGISLLGGCRSSDSAAGRHPDRTVSIAAAADLKFALDEIVREFGKRNTGIRINVVYGSSGNFFSQLANEAPFDVFLSADLDYPKKLAQQGVTLQDSEFTYAVGRIALWVPTGSPIEVEKLGMSALKHASVVHIAIANPEHAPYGRAAEAAMRSTGIYESVKAKLVYGENVAQTLQFVQSGNAEIGIVALSLAVSPAVRKQGRFCEAPMESYPRMEQGGVILKWAKDLEAARALRAFLMESEGRAILKKFGFSQPGA